MRSPGNCASGRAPLCPRNEGQYIPARLRGPSTITFYSPVLAFYGAALALALRGAVDILPTAVPLTGKITFNDPWHVHTTEPSVVVPPTVSFHAGAADPLVPAVVTSCLLPDGSLIAAPKSYTVEGRHAGKVFVE